MGGQRATKESSREGLTPLMYAVQNGSIEATRLLLEARALVTARDEDGLGPLHFAAASGNLEVCRLLRRYGADVDMLDEDGRNAMAYVPKGCLATKADRAQWEAELGLAKETLMNVAPIEA